MRYPATIFPCGQTITYHTDFQVKNLIGKIGRCQCQDGKTTITLTCFYQQKRLLGNSALLTEMQKCIDIITITFHFSAVLLWETENQFSKLPANMTYSPTFRKHTQLQLKKSFSTPAPFQIWKGIPNRNKKESQAIIWAVRE